MTTKIKNWLTVTVMAVTIKQRFLLHLMNTILRDTPWMRCPLR